MGYGCLSINHADDRPDLTDEEQAALAAALRKLIAEDKFPFSPRLKPLAGQALCRLSSTAVRRSGKRGSHLS
jgi:hypothetical protein